MASDSVTGVVLCGGAGARMGGADKPLLPLLGQPLVERVLTRLAPQVDRLLIVANRRPADYAAFGPRVTDDGRHAGRGPLAGIAAGLAAATTAWVLCVPGDAPLLPPDLCVRLRRAVDADHAEAAVVHDGAGRQPLCCLLPRRLLCELETYLDGGGTAPREWLRRYRVAEADCGDWPRWAWSANTPAEWAAAEHALQAMEPRACRA